MRHSVLYTFGFSAAVCGVCAILVSTAAVSLAERQEINKALDLKRNVLQAAGSITPGEAVTSDEINERFGRFEAVVVTLSSGLEDETVDPAAFDQRAAKKDPDLSHAAPANRASVKRVPNQALVYKMIGDDGELEMLVLPIEGYGLWSTLYGFLALSPDLTTIAGLAYYEHGETPGLGGEVDNPSWRARWPGRKAFDENWQTAIEVIKGRAGTSDVDPYRVDGLSGATITSRGVTNMMELWLGPGGFGPFLERLRAGSDQQKGDA